MRLSLLTIAMWVTHSKYVKEVISCNITLSAKTNLVDLGSSVALACQVCPSTSVTNFEHNSSNIAPSQFGQLSVQNKSLYELTYDAETRKFNLTIIHFTRSSVGNYSCFIPFTTDMSLLTLEHSIPVTSVTLTPAIPTISIVQDVTTSVIKCISSEGRPTPSITWYLDKNTPSDDINDLNITSRSSSETTRDVTTIVLTITPTFDDHGSNIYCKVTNGYGQIISNSKLYIDVLVVPSRPTILHKSISASDSSSVILNSTVSLECSSSGNPTPNISWILSNGSVINNRGNDLKWENRVNTDMVTCRATSVMKPTYSTQITHYNTTDLRINILYLPSTPTCSIGDMFITLKTIREIKKESLTITCTRTSNPPPMSYSWTLPGGIKQDGQTLTIPRVLSDGQYTLDVNNVMTSTLLPHVITGHVNVIFTLDILFSVAVQHIQNQTVLRNQALSVMCPYTPGNPPETSFTWIHVNTSRVVEREQGIALLNMQTSDEGMYKCRVNNTMTPTGCCTQVAFDETPFYVDVQYAANITRFYATGFETASNITVNENETVVLHCASEGDPLASMLLMNNTRGENDLLRENYHNTISASIPRARCEYDMGIYQCRANNTHNKDQHVREIEIKIKCAPRSSPFMPPVPKLWTKTNGSVLLTYTIVAFPPPSLSSAFVWWKQVNEKWLILNNTSRLHIHNSQDRLQTNLSILQVQEDDFTNYTVRVNNTIGSTEHAFVIQSIEEPAMPTLFRVVEELVTDKSVTIEWIPGFNGGEQQWFFIGYKQEVSKQWLYKNVSEDIHRISIAGLVSGTSYQFKIYAENSIGTSKETDVILFLTRDDGSSPSVGAVGGTLVIVIFVVLWKCRNRFKQSQHRNQYETLAETSFHQYSVILTGGIEENRVLNRVSEVSNNDFAVKKEDKV